MSKIDELIGRLCPDGVEYKKLSCLASYARERIAASDLEPGSYVGVNELLQEYRGRSYEVHVPSEEKCISYRPGDVLLGNIRPYLKKMWLADCSGGTNGDVLVIRVCDDAQLSPRFLWQVLAGRAFTEYNISHSKGTKMPRGDKRAIMDFRIPVPPMEVQEEIVRVLDSFAELEARKRQYAHYRDLLLTFEERERERVRWVTLGDICSKVCSGSTPNKKQSLYYEGGNIPWLRTQEVDFCDVYDTGIKITEAGLANSSAKMIPANCVIVAMYGATAGKAAVNKIPLCTNQACCNLEINPSVALYRYVYHWVCKEYENIKSLGQGSQNNISGATVKGYPIPVPSLETQGQIVEALDQFDALVNDISQGLPAEIEARRKQYTYYRDKLLSFKEKVA